MSDLEGLKGRAVCEVDARRDELIRISDAIHSVQDLPELFSAIHGSIAEVLPVVSVDGRMVGGQDWILVSSVQPTRRHESSITASNERLMLADQSGAALLKRLAHVRIATHGF